MRIWQVSLIAILAGAVGGGLVGRLQCRPGGDQYVRLLAAPTRVATPVRRGASRRVVVENGAEFDFGVMEREQTRSHVFRIRNNTSQPLSLHVIEKTCKCTLERLPQDAIPPGEVAGVSLEWTAKTYDSEFRQSATLQTSDPVQGLVTLSVFGRIMQVVSADPGEIAFSNVPLGGSAQREFVVRSFEDTSLDIERWEWSDAEFGKYIDLTWSPAPVTKVPGLPDPKSALHCILRLRPGLPLGAFEKNVVLHTTSARSSKVVVAVGGNIVSDVTIVGLGFDGRRQRLELGVVAARTGLTRGLRLLVKGEGRQSFEVLEARTDPADLLKVRIQPPREFNGGAVRLIPLEVSIPPGSRPAYFLGGKNRPAGKIVLTTNHATVRQLTIDTRFSIVENAAGAER